MNISSVPITQDDRFIIFLLSHVNSIGCETIKRIDSRLDKMSDICRLSEGELKTRLSMNDAQIYEFLQVKTQFKSIMQEYDALLRSAICYTTFKDADYPSRLRHIRQSPAVLYSYGSLPDSSQPCVGIVGSRASTAYGSSVAEYFAEELALHGVNIISGMAVGIDAAAHKGSLKAAHNTSDIRTLGLSHGQRSNPSGKSFAVLAGGVNVIYPRENKYIYDEIISTGHGAIISEMIPGKAAISRNFPMRNRIISGFSDIVLVVEAREKSGSLITVDYAKSQDIPVMAIPGRITDPMSRGTNSLIREGYDIANSPNDILERLKIHDFTPSVKNKEKVKSLDNPEKIVYSTVVSDPKHIEIIFQETGLSRNIVLEALISLELQGLISQVSSNYYIRN